MFGLRQSRTCVSNMQNECGRLFSALQAGSSKTPQVPIYGRHECRFFLYRNDCHEQWKRVTLGPRCRLLRQAIRATLDAHETCDARHNRR